MVYDRDYEEKNLKEVLEKYKEVIEDLSLQLKSLNNKQTVDYDVLYDMIRKCENKLRITKEGLNKPYFARIDYKDEKEDKEEVCYIGKVGVSDFDHNIVTVDWRAPIASLYYDSNIGEASYKAPDGIRKGVLSLKRQYDIEKGELISFNDVDTVSNDEILRPYLDVNADNRLKNIVSSIQEEQNRVIRKDLSDNVVIQGVAGSGKTTVALHRIAYLAYNHRDKIKSDRYMVIGPNKVFMNYISSVLPDLDVTDVLQLTYEEFVKRFLQEDLIIEDLGKTKGSFNINKYKMSMQYKNDIDNYVLSLDTEQVVPKKDFEVKGFNILSQKTVAKIYDEIDDEFYTNLEEKIERCIFMITSLLRDREEVILDSLLKQYNEKMSHTKNEAERMKLNKTYQEVKQELANTCFGTSLKKYFTFRNKKVSTLYNEFLDNYSKFGNQDAVLEVKNSIFKAKEKFTYEDLAGLLYLGYKVKSSRDYKKYRHTIIDEAQDYGDLNFYALKKILSASSFSIFGDLAQSIYDYRSIDNWENVISEVFSSDCNLEYLLKSYRTTIEIMNSANEVLSYMGLKTAEPVIRHGEEVRIIKIDKDYYKELLKRIEELEKKNYESIALISRNEKLSHEIKDGLEKNGKVINEITNNNQEYNGGICSVSSSLAKGLEFDAVIITDASEDKFSSSNMTDMKNLYVSMTRPLHQLEILYNGELTKPLQKCLKK